MLQDKNISNIVQILQSQFEVVNIQKLPTGSVRLRLVSTKFLGLDNYSRYDLVNDVLKPLGIRLGSVEISAYILITPDEDEKYLIDFPSPLPTWSELLSAPEPLDIKPLDDNVKKPLIVTFYSFKGGVGRSTCLAIVSRLLSARKRKVVMIDFDLEAPGLTSSINIPEDQLSQSGVLDYVYQRWISPESNMPSLNDCIQKIGDESEDLFLIPAGRYDQNYIYKLADFEVAKYYRKDPNPIRLLIDEIKQKFSPDVIMIDARTGFDDIGAMALLDLADLGVICFTPSKQSYQGLDWVTKVVRKQQSIQGRPDLRFVLTPLPVTNTQDHDERLNQAEDWITEHWPIESGIVPEDLYIGIDYNPIVAIMDNPFADLPESTTGSYKPIADWIDTSLPETIQTNNMAPKQIILDELKFESSITADQINPEVISQIFQRTSDFPKFVQDAICLIRGAKGTGKSLLFRLFVEQPASARDLARPSLNLDDVNFIGVHGRLNLDSYIVSSQGFIAIEKRLGENVWRNFWPAYALLKLVIIYPKFIEEIKGNRKIHETISHFLVKEKTQKNLVDTLILLSEDSLALQINDSIKILNQKFVASNKQVWLFYDELDSGFGHTQADYLRRKRALEGLMVWWLEFGNTFNYIHMKCLLREDIWQQLRFPNKSHYTGKDMSLKWQEDDLWRLVLRQALNSPSFSSLVSNLSVNKDSLEQLEIDRLRKALVHLWGERMGPGNKAYTHRWVLRRITDGQDNRFPRSLIVLLLQALEYEKKSGNVPAQPLLKPRSLISAMPAVSENRVSQVKEEYPELEKAMDALNDQSSPLDKQTLIRIFAEIEKKPEELISQLLQAGILEKRKSSESDSDRYAVSELYLLGLKMRRKGQR